MADSIIFDSEAKTFSLNTAHTTYQLQIDRYGVLLHLYYGSRAIGRMDFLLTYADRGTSGNIYDAGNHREYSYDALPQEYPTSGMGDFRSPAFVLENEDGSIACDLRYLTHEIRDGKYSLPGLPAVYADESEAQTLEVVLADDAAKIKVHLLYGVLPENDIITRSAIIENYGDKELYLKKVLSANLDFLTGKYDLVTFYGRHAMERKFQREAVTHGAKVIGSRRGASSHQYNPMMLLCEKNTTESAGLCYSMQFVYSGGFTGLCEKDGYDQTRWQLGLMDEKFSYPLLKGESFAAPEVILSCSTSGLSSLSQQLHECIKKHVCRGKWRDIERPVLLNSWEAFYFSFTGEDLLGLADQAAELGMDMLVMDDGWFGKRDDDNSGLGDWYVNEEKLGGSLGSFIEKINEKGLKFGIWFEPEMVNEDSDLYRKHPDWAFVIPGRNPVRCRNQLVLDFSRQEVVDHIFEQTCKVLDCGNIEYLKWDYNRSIADVFSHDASDQGRVLYDYILGLYDFLERLTNRYPDLLIEGCSGGGGRFDAGMLYYTPQIWTSDNTDAIDRLRIQYGTSFGYPLSTMGAHVSAVPNEMNGRVTPLNTRSIVAMAGTYGYEMDPKLLTDEERGEIKKQVAIFKKYSALIHNGKYYRLSDPFADDYTAWMVVSEDGSEALLSAVITNERCNPLPHYVKLAGLMPNSYYHNDTLGQTYSADALMNVGLPLPNFMNQYAAYQWHLTKTNQVDVIEK